METFKESLKECITQFQKSCDAFMGTLELEKNAINARDADALLKIATSKKELINEISLSDKTLNSIAGKIQIELEESLNNYIENLQEKSLSNMWNAVTDSVQACMIANKQNEYLLASSINHVSQALNLLITTATGEPCSTYTKHGYETNISSDSVLVKA